MARFYALIEESRRRKQNGDTPVTRDMLRELGEATTFFAACRPFSIQSPRARAGRDDDG